MLGRSLHSTNSHGDRLTRLLNDLGSSDVLAHGQDRSLIIIFLVFFVRDPRADPSPQCLGMQVIPCEVQGSSVVKQ